MFEVNPELYEDPSGRADRICRFIKALTLWEGNRAGEEFKLYPFQEAIIRRIYGPVGNNNSRQVRIACIWTPRGQAKTTLAAALALAHFLGPAAEQGGQVIMAAADRQNAGIAFRCAHKMVLQEDELKQRVKAVESQKLLKHPRTNSMLQAVSTEAYSKHGLNCSFFLADEIHAWPPAEARNLFKVITDGMVKRINPLTVIISTAGEGTGGLAYDLWDYSHKVASGEIEDPTFAPIILAADPNCDWRDENVWKSCNPAIEAGFCSIDELRIKRRRIEHFPSEISDFKRYHLNIWLDGAGQPWLPLELYDQAEPVSSMAELAGRECWVGIDLSSVQDLTAVVAVFPEGDEDARRYDVLARFFLPRAALGRRVERDRADYEGWSTRGFVSLTSGNVVDYQAVVDYCLELAESYVVREVVIDRWNSTAVNTALQEYGFKIHEFGQGMKSMAAPVRELKRAILAGHFRHGGNPVLRMCFGNVVTEKDAAENEKFTKEKAAGRIDGAVASAMAIGAAMEAAKPIDISALIG